MHGRVAGLVVLGLAGILVSGCSSSPTTDGGTTTGGSTTAGTTTTTSSGTSTGGTSTSTSTSGTSSGGTTGAGGSACSGGAMCASNLCLGNVCCSAASCPSDPGCGATACDATGACVYPSGSACGDDCSGHMLTPKACDATGTCAAQTPAACAGNFVCADATTCKTSCAQNSDCDTGFVCSNAACVSPIAAGGACTADAACISGVCGVNGTGNCCTAACNTTDATCGATACDAAGGCVYPVAPTACGASCTGGTLTSSACDGLGACIAGASQPCPGNLDCKDATSCTAGCTDNSVCTAGSFCDLGTMSACCPAIATGTGLTIDNTTGSDMTACCGYGTAGPCQTLTRAMQLVGWTNGLTAGTLVTLNASVNGQGGDWMTETFPVSLGWGVTLSAPGVYFSDTNGNLEIFDIALQTGETAPANPVVIGVPSVKANDRVVIGVDLSGNLTSDPLSITVEGGQTLDLLNAQVWEAPNTQILCPNFPWCGTAIEVQKTATLDVGSDATGHSGTVYLGGMLPNGNSPSFGKFSRPARGILCNGTIADSPTGANPSLVSQHESLSIDAEDACAITLANDPTFGAPSSGGFTNAGNGCANIVDDTGILANGDGATVTLSGATFSCMASYGIAVTNSGPSATAAVVTVQPDGQGIATTIENCEAAGVFASAGSTYLIGAIVQYNFRGVDMETDLSVGTNPDGLWLNDGTGIAPSTNTSVTCNSNQETGDTIPGIDVYNNSTATVNADYVNWDQWYDPNGGGSGTTTDVFYCDDNFTCTCQVFDSSDTAVCVNTGNDDLDLALGTGTGSSPSGNYSAQNGASSGSGCQ